MVLPDTRHAGTVPGYVLDSLPPHGGARPVGRQPRDDVLPSIVEHCPTLVRFRGQTHWQLAAAPGCGAPLPHLFVRPCQLCAPLLGVFIMFVSVRLSSLIIAPFVLLSVNPLQRLCALPASILLRTLRLSSPLAFGAALHSR
jgi:hypothetical protein